MTRLPTYTRAAAHLGYVLARTGPRLDRVQEAEAAWAFPPPPVDWRDHLADWLVGMAALRLARVRSRLRAKGGGA